MAKRQAKNTKDLHPAEKIDLELADAVALDPRGRAAKIVAAVAELGDQPPMIAASVTLLGCGLAFHDRRMTRAGVRMLAAHGVATFAKTILKDRIDRTRPDEALERDRYRLEKGDSQDGDLRSMPSGHSAGVIAVARAAARDYPSAAMPLAAGALAVSGTQLPSRSHFLTDVLAGAAIGLTSEAIASALIDRADRLLTVMRGDRTYGLRCAEA